MISSVLNRILHLSRLIGIIGVLFIPLLASAQRPFSFDNSSRKRVTIPFRYERNMIIVPVMINGQGPFNFILDTGVSIFIVTDPDLKDSLGLIPTKSIRIKGLGEGEDLEALIIPGMEVKIGPTTAKHLAGAMITKDEFHLSSYVGIPVYGIIGFDFFNSFTVRINYLANKLTIFEPSKFKYDKFAGRKKFESIPLILENNRPYFLTHIELDDNTIITSKLIIDCGAGHPVMLEPNSDPAIQIPPVTINALLGVGLNGPINGHIGRINTIYMGNYQIHHPLVSFPDHETTLLYETGIKRNGNIGNEILKRFTIIMDYSRKELLLKPNRRFDDPFEHDMSGMSLVSDGKSFRRYFITRIMPNSPAEEAGLEIDDEIMSINLRPAKEMTISEIDNLLRSRENRNLLIEIGRKGESDLVILTLKRSI